MSNDKRNNRSKERYNESGRDDQSQEKRPPSKSPSHIAFQVRDGEEGKSYFNRIGSAFPHKDGEGFNVVLDSTPVDGRVTLRTPKERMDDMKEGKRSDNRRGASQQRDDGPQYDR